MPPQPIIEAHRGDSSNAPENTLAAFERALHLGVPWIELDVHPSRDGRLMVIHDRKVDRTTDGSGKLLDLTAHDLRRLDAGSWFDPAFAGEKIPFLEEVMELAQPTGTRLNIEIKSSPPGHDVPGAVVRLIRDHGRVDSDLVSSFDLDAVLAVGDLAPEVVLAYTGRTTGVVDTAIGHKFQWVHPRFNIADAAFVEKAHSAGLKVNVWTVDDPGRVAHWRAVGVDKICSNRPGPMMEAVVRGR